MAATLGLARRMSSAGFASIAVGYGRQEEIVVALPTEHAPSARPQVTFDQLAAEDLIAHRENSALRRRLERTMADRGLEPRNAFICTEMPAVRGLASKGLGVAVFPRSVAEQPGPPIELRPIGPERLTWPVALVWRAARRLTAPRRVA
jgi:DNA-binding transcriptional LysR family regulator